MAPIRPFEGFAARVLRSRHRSGRRICWGNTWFMCRAGRSGSARSWKSRRTWPARPRLPFFARVYARTRVMFGRRATPTLPGIRIHCCMNVVTEREGHASPCCWRAVEPVMNVEGSTRGPGDCARRCTSTGASTATTWSADDFFIADPHGAGSPRIVRRPGSASTTQGAGLEALRFYIRGTRSSRSHSHVCFILLQLITSIP